MKYIPLLFFVIFFVVSTSAQSDRSAFTHQFGFDAAGFLSRFVNFSGSGTSETPYYLTYRKLGESKNTRLGLGANLSVEGNGSGSTSSQNAINFRVGSERFNDFGKRWRAFYGWDFRMLFSYFTTGNGNTTQLSLGAAPLFGLQWRLNERLSFSTEMAYNLFLTVRDTNGRTRFGASTSFSPPVAFYVNYDF